MATAQPAHHDVTGLHLALLFTRGVGLADWRRIGSLDRELALYRRMVDAGMTVTIITYGGAEDQAIAREIAPIRVRANHRNLPIGVYARLIPWLHRDVLRACDVVKTNQVDGADVALRAARWWGKPLIARCGYMWSLNLARRRGENDRRTRRAKRIESKVFSRAARVQVTTEAMAQDVAQRVPAAAANIRVVPNYVLTDLFCPAQSPVEPTHDLLYVGRLTQEKNLEALLDAVADLPLRVAMIGEGPLREPLMQQASRGKARVDWLGGVPHAQLPGFLRRAKAFILPSLYEGHPKALLEAMACGTAVIASDQPGLRELIEHGRTGYLCPTDAIRMRTAIQTVLGDRALRGRMGSNARDRVVERFSLDKIFDLERRVIAEAVDHG